MPETDPGAAMSHVATPAPGRVFQKLTGRVATLSLILFLLTGCVLTATKQAGYVFQATDVSYGDSYVFYDVLHYQRTGELYRDLSRPPYLPVVYSPLVYMAYSVPGRLVSFANPFVGPRLLSLVVFLLCVAVTIWIARSLIPGANVWWWALLLACSIEVMRDWVLQMRGDFFGVLFSLLAIRLLFVQTRWAVIAAGLSAGFATQFKFTFVAAMAAGVLWLLVRREWRRLARFGAAALLSSVGLYVLFWSREPRMLAQITALSPIFADVGGDLKLIYHVVSEPAVLLAALAVSPLAWNLRSRWALFACYGCISFCVAALTDLQAGGNLNYYYECLFAIIPAAVLGARRLTHWARQRMGAGLFVTALFAFFFLPPLVRDLDASIHWAVGAGGVEARNQEFEKFQRVLQGRHIFSSIQRIALLDPRPALLDPFLLNYLQRTGRFDPKPVFDRIRNAEFDVVVTASGHRSYRGLPHVGPAMHNAIVASYQAYCTYSEYLVHLRRNQPDNNALAQELTQIGCQPVVCGAPENCPSW